MITRDNYQEFFLLYVDNELSAADARAVEEWVAANPDLKEEWESLQVCRVDPDEKVIFPGKDSLFRGDVRDGERALEYLLSYVDGELSPAERREAEARIATRPADAAELERLLLTVSKPDSSVVFPDKSSLYRKEKDRRVIWLLRAVAGAAAAILIAVPLLIKKGDHAVTPGGVVALQDKTPVRTTPETRDSAKDQDVLPAGETTREPRQIAVAQNQRPTREPQRGRQPQQSRQPRTATDVAIGAPTPDRKEGLTADVAATRQVPDPITEIKSTEPSVAVRQADIRQNEIPKDQSSFATQALLQEDDEKGLASAGQQTPAGKNKLRGLFRKVARTFGSTAERDGEGKREVLISAFQVAVN